MSRVTSRSREMTTGSRWADNARDVLPRELDEEEYSAAMMSQPGVDDGDQYLLFTVPASQYDTSPAAAWTGGKTKVWRRMDNGSGNFSGGGGGGSDMLSMNSKERKSRNDRSGASVTLNGPSRYHATAAEHFKSCDDRCPSNTPTSSAVQVETKLTSTGQSPSSTMSPTSPRLLSPTSRPSAIPVRVTTNSGMFQYLSFHLHIGLVSVLFSVKSVSPIYQFTFNLSAQWSYILLLVFAFSYSYSFNYIHTQRTH